MEYIKAKDKGDARVFANNLHIGGFPDGKLVGSPVVNPEALACGTPIVGTNVGGIPEIVIDEVTGLLIPPNDPIELVNAIQRLLEDKDLRGRCGGQDMMLVEQSFSWTVITKKLCVIYEEMI